MCAVLKYLSFIYIGVFYWQSFPCIWYLRFPLGDHDRTFQNCVQPLNLLIGIFYQGQKPQSTHFVDLKLRNVRNRSFIAGITFSVLLSIFCHILFFVIKGISYAWKVEIVARGGMHRKLSFSGGHAKLFLSRGTELFKWEPLKLDSHSLFVYISILAVRSNFWAFLSPAPYVCYLPRRRYKFHEICHLPNFEAVKIRNAWPGIFDEFQGNFFPAVPCMDPYQ